MSPFRAGELWPLRRQSLNGHLIFGTVFAGSTFFLAFVEHIILDFLCTTFTPMVSDNTVTFSTITCNQLSNPIRLSVPLQFSKPFTQYYIHVYCA